MREPAPTPETDRRPPPWLHDRKGSFQRVRDYINPLPDRGTAVAPEQRTFEEALGAFRERSPAELSDQSLDQLLVEAEAAFASRRDQALRAEARATTLQGSVGIAIGLVLTGSAFLLDPTKVADRGWRIALAAVLMALLLSLAMAGYVATRATLKLLTFKHPTPAHALDRARMEVRAARWDRAVQLLCFSEQNMYFSAFKIKQVKVAGLWFRAALLTFGGLSVLLMAYVAFGPIPRSLVH